MNDRPFRISSSFSYKLRFIGRLTEDIQTLTLTFFSPRKLTNPIFSCDVFSADKLSDDFIRGEKKVRGREFLDGNIDFSEKLNLPGMTDGGLTKTDVT